MCHNMNTHENCEKCLGGHFTNCVKGKCIHGSLAKSVTGMIEATFWKWKGVYKYIDTVICCSRFMKTKLDTNPIFSKNTVVMHNFVEPMKSKAVQKKDYVLYFGRYSQEKGITTLLDVAKELPEIQFVFAGTGPLEGLIDNVPNIKNVGFQTGEALETLIREARFTVYPSEWYENCPFSVMESQMYGTPVVGANIGGIPELIKQGETGELFQSKSAIQLKDAIFNLWNNKRILDQYTENCLNVGFSGLDEYYADLIKIYLSN